MVSRCLFIVDGYLPRSLGGTAVFAHYLGRELKNLGVQVRVAYHRRTGDDPAVGESEWDGIPVQVLPPIQQPMRLQKYQRGGGGAPGLGQLLQAYAPDVVHFHGFSYWHGVDHVDVCKQQRIPTLLTMHTPGQWCAQGNLLRRGKTVCDGVFDQVRCSECFLRNRGAPIGVSHVVSRAPPVSIGSNLQSKIAKTLSSPAIVRAHWESWLEMYQGVDRVHVLANWVIDMLRANGLPTDKVRLVRTGVPYNSPTTSTRYARPKRDPNLRLAFVGRFTEVKGVKVLIDAVRSLPENAPVRVEFWSPNAKPDTPYRRELLEIIEKDRRFERPVQLRPDEIVPSLRQVDVCVVPSLWLETGPLVVPEAFAAGVPVLGSDLGGIQELVRDNVDGLLFSAGASRELAFKIERLISEASSLEYYKSNIVQPRSMGDLAMDTQNMYQEIL